MWLPAIYLVVCEFCFPNWDYNYWANKHIPWRTNNSGKELYDQYVVSCIEADPDFSFMTICDWDYLPNSCRKYYNNIAIRKHES